MGCWNATCGISQLPILFGEKIRVFILKPERFERDNPNMMCYPTDYYTAFSIPFLAEYNDYGAVENIVENYNTKIIHNKLKKMVMLPKDKPFTVGDSVKFEHEYLEVTAVDGDMITVKERHRPEPIIYTDYSASNLRHDNNGEQGDGQNYYDDCGDLEQMVRLIERGAFEITGCNYFNNDDLAIPGLFYVRENIWQALIADVEEENEYSFGYKSRETRMKHVDEFLEKLIKLIKEIFDNDDKKDDELRHLSFFRLSSLESLCDGNNRIGDMFRNSRDGFSANIYRDWMIDHIREDDIDTVKTMLIDAMDTSRFIGVMYDIRKSLRPQCGAGSQTVGEKYHRTLVVAISSELDVIDNYFDCDDDE